MLQSYVSFRNGDRDNWARFPYDCVTVDVRFHLVHYWSARTVSTTIRTSLCILSFVMRSYALFWRSIFLCEDPSNHLKRFRLILSAIVHKVDRRTLFFLSVRCHIKCFLSFAQVCHINAAQSRGKIESAWWFRPVDVFMKAFRLFSAFHHETAMEFHSLQGSMRSSVYRLSPLCYSSQACACDNALRPYVCVRTNDFAFKIKLNIFGTLSFYKWYFVSLKQTLSRWPNWYISWNKSTGTHYTSRHGA